KLARDLLQISGAPPITPSLAVNVTPSLNAYRDYLAGITFLNSWQLDSADAAFVRAIERDSGFALAHYKRGLAAGWSSKDDLGLASARLAVANAGRLPPRERALVEAFLSLSEGLAQAVRGELVSGTDLLTAARQQYSDIIARDSQYAEAWYGLGDAHFHLAGMTGQSSISSYSAALRAFDRTLALDSSFHLAYQHKLQVYQEASLPGRPFLLVGDTLVPASSVSDPERAAEARRHAGQLAVRDARHWVALDPGATMAHRTLAYAHSAVGDYASAVSTMRNALTRAGVNSPDMYYEIATFELGAGRWREANAALEEARRIAPLDSLQARGSGNAFLALAAATSVAMHGGRIRDALQLVEEAGMLQATPQPAEEGAFSLTQYWRSLVALGGAFAGVPWPQAKPLVDSTLESFARMPGINLGDGVNIGYPIMAMVVSQDSTYDRYIPERFAPRMEGYAAYQAWRALNAGDTTRVLELSRG